MRNLKNLSIVIILISFILVLYLSNTLNMTDNSSNESLINSSNESSINSSYKSSNASLNSSPVIDKFGIKELYNSYIGGREWYSKWDNKHARTWNASSDDPYDEEFITQYKGVGSWSTDGKGILKISGFSPRMYVIDPEEHMSWHNVEITVYGQRISDNNISYAGIMAYARTNHMIDTNECDTRGYGGRFTLDGRIDFEKEIAHHAPNGYAQVATKYYWSEGMPKNVWIGYKFVVYDIKDGNVRLELWMDTTDGFNGGNWTKVDEFIDTGNNFGKGLYGCKFNISPYDILSNSDNRPGSETGKPNLAVYFRSDDIGTDGLWYKKASIREIVIN